METHTFNRIEKDLEKILLTKYKKHNFDIISLYQSIKPPIGSSIASTSIEYSGMFYLAEKYRKYNDVLEYFYFPKDECFGNSSNHITKFVLKIKSRFREVSLKQ